MKRQVNFAQQADGKLPNSNNKLHCDFKYATSKDSRVLNQPQIQKLQFDRKQQVTLSDQRKKCKVKINKMPCSTLCKCKHPTHLLQIRELCDTSIETVLIPKIKINKKLFNADLVKAVIGPLGRFYEMPKQNSQLQFINSFHQIDISDILTNFKGKKLMIFSINNFLNLIIPTFYFADFLSLKYGLELKDYIVKSNSTQKNDIQVQMNVEIGQNEIENLKYMTIRTLGCDQNYDNFLLVYMMDYFNPINLDQKYCPQNDHRFNDSTNNRSHAQNLKETYFHIVQIYSEPELKHNESSHLNGHFIIEFTGTELENGFIIDNNILMLSIRPECSFIQKYRILDFKFIHNRDYPLYDQFITKNGIYSINSGFLFVQVQQLKNRF